MGVFSRDEEEQLAYNADAFFYFAGTILLVVLIPWTLQLLRWIIWPRPSREEDFDSTDHASKDAVVRHCTTAAMESKRLEARTKAEDWHRRFGPGRQLQLLVLLVGWCCFFACVSRLRPITFDPHTTLGLIPGASLQEIKKAFRKMSLQHHPDKDRDNPLAPVIFQQITKAYRTLTDEKARKNYERWGNPDGPVGMKVGIALHPVILLSKEIQLKTLCLFFAVLFGVPLSIVCCCLRGSNLSTGGVCAETLRTFYACIDGEVGAEDGPGLLAASAEAQRLGSLDLRVLVKAMTEFRPSPLEPGTVVEVCDGGAYQGRRGLLRDIGTLCEVELWPEGPKAARAQAEGLTDVQSFARQALTPAEPLIVCPFSDPPIRRCAALVWAHMWRLHRAMPPAVRARVDALLKHSVRVTHAAVSIAAHGQPGASCFEVVAGLVRFKRALVQALEIEAAPLLQLPHVTKVPASAPSLAEVVKAGGLSPALVRQLDLTDNQRLDIEAFCRHAPRVELSCVVEVPDEENIAEGDLAALTVTLRRLNLEENEAAGPVHAPLFPVPKYEEWWILVYDERARRLVTTDLIQGARREESCKVHFMVPRPGKHRWTVHALCDSYMGLDATCPAHFDALRRKDVSHEIFTHPDDMQIKSLFEELMEGLHPEDADEESSDDEPPKVVAAAAPQAQTQAPAQAPVQAQAQEQEDSEDEMGAEQEESFFFRAPGESGIFIYRCPQDEPQNRLGSVPKGTVLRGFVEGAPEGWARLYLEGGAWIRVSNQGTDVSQEESQQENTPARCVGRLGEQDFRTVVQTRPPLFLVRRWLQSCDAQLRAEDVRTMGEIDDSRVRMLIEEMVREKVGDERFEQLLDKAQALAKQYGQRLQKARGFFSSQNGMIWHVSARGSVRGLAPDDSRLRDKVEVTKADELRIGPFRLDETRTCSCIHWLRVDDPNKSWVWSRDSTLRTRVRLGLAF